MAATATASTLAKLMAATAMQVGQANGSDRRGALMGVILGVWVLPRFSVYGLAGPSPDSLRESGSSRLRYHETLYA